MILDRAMRAGVMAIRSTGYAWIVLACGVAASVALSFAVHKRVESVAKLRFESDVRDAGGRIQNRIQSYADVVYGIRALFQVEGFVSRGDFHKYVDALNLGPRYPGLQSINFAQYVPAERKAAFEAAVRRDASLNGRGYPEFRIRPPGERPAYYVLTYLEPMEEAVFGNDIAMNNYPINLRVLELQRDTNAQLSSGRLVQIRGAERYVGLAMRLPVYRTGQPIETVEQRRLAYIGSVGAGFRVRESLDPIIATSIPKPVDFKLYNIGPVGTAVTQDRLVEDNFLYSSRTGKEEPPDSPDPERTAEFSAVQGFQFGGRQMVIHFSASRTAYIDSIAQQAGVFVLSGGLIITLLLTALVYSLGRSRHEAQSLAEEMTSELQESKAFLTEAQRMARIGSWLLYGDGRMQWSEETCRILNIGAPPVEATLANFLDFVYPEDREALRALLRRCCERQERQEIDHRLRLPDGVMLWIHSIVESTLVRGQRVVRGTSKDITLSHGEVLRKETENAIFHTLATALDPADAVQKVVEALSLGLGWGCGIAWSVDQTGATLECIASWGKDRTVWPFLKNMRGTALAAESGLFCQFQYSTDPFWIDDIATNGDFPQREGALEAGLRRALFVPVIVDARLQYVLEFCMQEHEPYKEEMLVFAKRQADQLAQYLQRREAENRLQYVATHDALTQLLNRASFVEQLALALKRAVRNRQGVAVLFLDLDRFKVVNDTIGHSAGDRLLQECASRFKASLREFDTLARFGGDEFVVLVDQISDPHQVPAVATRLLASLAAPFSINGTEVTLCASVGISTYPEDGDDAETLLKNADIAMYRAKQEGRGAHQFYSASLNQYSYERLNLETSLRRALERNEFCVHYQPKLNLASGRLESMEALIRWQRPGWGMVAPDQFIPVAEETGLIIPIGNWVLDAVCRQIELWRAQGRTPCRVSVNLSARQFRDERLLDDISRIIGTTGVNAQRVEFELTESVVMNDPERATSIMRALKSTGFGLSIDDFGTGYSSLGRLKSFPIDSLKIDRTFVRGLPDDQDDAAIASGVIALAHSLHLSVVAEGVETPAQLNFLKAVGCDEIQGYLISRPLPAGEAMAVVESTSELKLISSV